MQPDTRGKSLGGRIIAVVRTSFRLLRIGLAVLAIALLAWSFFRVLARPINRSRELADRTELTVLHWGNREEDLITQQLVESFMSAHPEIKVRRINATANYYAKLKTMCASGDPPDVMFLNARDIPTYAGMGLLMDVEPFMKGEDIRLDDFYPPTINSFRYDGKTSGIGKLFGVPSNFTGLGFYYNKSLLARAAVSPPTDDWTWEEFEDKCRAIGRLEGLHGCALELTGDSFRAILETFGQPLLNADFSKLHARDDGVLRVLDRVRGWTLGQPDARIALATDPYDSVNSGSAYFALQRTGMYGPTGRWMVPEFRNIKEFEWDFAPMPKGTRHGTILYVAAWSISANTRHPRESWLLAKHLATPQGQSELARTGLAIPSLRSVATSDAFLDPTKPPLRSDLFLKDVENAWPSIWPPDSRFARRFSDHLQDCLRLGRRTIDESMRAATADWEQEQASPLRRADFSPAPWRWILAILGLLGVGVGIAGIAMTRQARSSTLRRTEARTGRLMVSPWLIGFMLFAAGPMVLSLILSFSKWAGLTTIDQAQWVGWLNYKEMLGNDPRFRNALWLTVKYAILGVPITQCAALLAAVLMAQNVAGTRFFRALWYLPSVLAGAGMAVMWRWVLDGRNGLLNEILAWFSPVVRPMLAAAAEIVGSPPPSYPPDWLGADADWAGVPAFVIASLWNIGGSMLIYLAGLHAIPKTLYEAAAIDGASAVRRFFTVTVPMLSPVILFNVVIALISSFQVFTQAYVMTQGGPGDSTRFYVLYLYNHAFENHQMGYASAMAWVLLLIVLALTTLVLWQGHRRVHYGGLKS